MGAGQQRKRQFVACRDSDFSIVATYQAEYRGLVQYCLVPRSLWLSAQPAAKRHC